MELVIITLIIIAIYLIVKNNNESKSNNRNVTSNKNNYEMQAEDYVKRGLTNFNQKNYQQAIDDCSQAIRLNPKFADAYFFRGLVYVELRNWGQSIADFSESININPKYESAYSNRACSVVQQKDSMIGWLIAIEDYDQALNINPSNAVNFFCRGLVYFKFDKQKAKKDFIKAIELNPNYEDAQKYIALLEAQDKPLDLDFFTEKLEESSETNKRDLINRNNNNIKPESYTINQKGSFSDNDLDEQIDKAIKLKREGNYQQAYSIYQELDRKYPDNASLLFAWAKTTACLNKFQEAKKYMEEAKIIYEKVDHPYAWQCQEHIDWLSNPNNSDEFQSYMASVSNNPNWLFMNNLEKKEDCEIYIKNGLSLGSSGNYKQAIECFNKAIELDPFFANAYFNRGFMYNKLNYPLEAIADFSQAISINPKHAQAYCERGFVYFTSWFATQQYLNQAISDLNQAIEIDSNFSKAYCILGFIYDSTENEILSVKNLKIAAKLGCNDAIVMLTNKGVNW